MKITPHTIEKWFNNGVNNPEKPSHLIVVCDTFDYSNYPIYVFEGQNVRDEVNKIDRKDMSKVMEVYNLKESRDIQINNPNCFNY